MTLNRNDHCWCGSNKKYKQCHLQFDEKIAHHQRNGAEVPPREIIKRKRENRISDNYFQLFCKKYSVI